MRQKRRFSPDGSPFPSTQKPTTIPEPR